MIKYYKLFDLLNRRDMNKSNLLAVTSSKTIAKLSKGANINTDVIDKICEYLECQPGDIMEYTYPAKDMHTGEEVDIADHQTWDDIPESLKPSPDTLNIYKKDYLEETDQ